MMENAIMNSSKNYFPEEKENVLLSIFKQYEYVVIQSIVTSFGLDFLVKDNLGGDVDTIHNVREGIYHNSNNKYDYDNRGEYNSYDYHSDYRYRETNKSVSENRKNGSLVDSYTGEEISRNGKSDLDHVISAKEIHEDAGRVLAGLDGVDLANSPENLQATNPHTNRTKKADSMNNFLDKYGDEYTETQKKNMREKDRIARESYEVKIAKAYYTSPKFAKDVTLAAGKIGVKMGLRQLLGFVFSEIWFSIKEEFVLLNVKPGLDMDMGDFFKSIGNGFEKGLENARTKYKDLFSKFADGTTAGILSSLTTTLCNIFLTTSKNIVKILRQSYASVVEATKILLINPDNYPFGERMRAAMKVISTGASVVLGGMVSEAISKTPIAVIPGIGDIVQTFCGTLCTGIVSCTLLFFIDQSKIINKAVNLLNKIDTIEDDIQYYKQKAWFFEQYAAELMEIDLDTFKKEISAYSLISKSINASTSDIELNTILKINMRALNISMSWEKSYDSFDSFMSDNNSKMIFE
ncbi:MAG: hypothetical protein Q4D76_18345 [Oscillospiraceae bacterium]|nr:hypothetical protein [Oscillospiraceae bacterium]